jgi:hypothetical protein
MGKQEKLALMMTSIGRCKSKENPELGSKQRAIAGSEDTAE